VLFLWAVLVKFPAEEAMVVEQQYFFPEQTQLNSEKGFTKALQNVDLFHPE
jgi:hypothetical protein